MTVAGGDRKGYSFDELAVAAMWMTFAALTGKLGGFYVVAIWMAMFCVLSTVALVKKAKS